MPAQHAYPPFSDYVHVRTCVGSPTVNSLHVRCSRESLNSAANSTTNGVISHHVHNFYNFLSRLLFKSLFGGSRDSNPGPFVHDEGYESSHGVDNVNGDSSTDTSMWWLPHQVYFISVFAPSATLLVHNFMTLVSKCQLLIPGLYSYQHN